MAAKSKLRKNLTDTLKLLARKLTYPQYHQVLVTIDSAMCGVEFGYDDHTKILKNVDLEINPRQIIGLELNPLERKNLKIILKKKW